MDRTIEEPVVTEAVKGQQAAAVVEAAEQGHKLGEWRWNGHDSWRAWCENKNCDAFVWVRGGALETGGNALANECWLKLYQRRRRRMEGST